MPPDPIERFREARLRAIFLDYDGTLSEIAPRPDLAVPVPGAVDVLERLSATNDLVAVVSGRPADEIRRLLPVEQVVVFGQYGIPEGTQALRTEGAVLAAVERAAAGIEGAWVEDKGASLAVHYRGALDPARAGDRLDTALRDIARNHGLALLAGKMVLELAPPTTPGKGAVVLTEARRRGVDGALYAGDDLADLPAFAALDELRSDGVSTLKVAVRTEETPDELIRSADVAAERPAGLVEILSRL